MKEQIIELFGACQPFGYPLLACSLVLVAAVIYHIWLNAGSFRGVARMSGLWDKAQTGDLDARRAFLSEANEGRSAAARLCGTIIQNSSMSDESLRPLVESKAREEAINLQGGLAAIDMIISIAPMFGILGTAWGLVEIFGVFGLSEQREGIAQGIATALYTTIFGLAVAAPGVIAVSCFNRRLEKCVSALEALANDVMVQRTIFH
ncbi:MAG: MotA/TolQ/ExbB proton channel family protein [Akkermansia sp.]|nr:MotA/TolQ/ExbB proton channel family protein [Akkermansia sp.]